MILSDLSGATTLRHGLKNCLQRVSSRAEARHVDDRSNVSLALGGPHGPVAAGHHLALDHGRSERAFAGLVGSLNQPGPATPTPQ